MAAAAPRTIHMEDTGGKGCQQKPGKKGSCWHEVRQGKHLLHMGKVAATRNNDQRSKVPDPSPVGLRVWHLTETFAVPRTKKSVTPNFSSNYRYLNVLKENLNETGRDDCKISQ